MREFCAVTDGNEEPNPSSRGVPCPSRHVPFFRSINCYTFHLAVEIPQTCTEVGQRHPPQEEEYLISPKVPHQSIDELSPALLDPQSQ